jgi:DNA-binding HxlR family transcriptional regulator
MDGMNDSHKNCAVSKTLKIVGSKWTMLLIHNIFEGKNRFGELQRALPGISPKTLSQRLRELERDEIISKKVFAEIPLHVEYTLTEKGKSLRGVVRSLENWGKKSQSQ